MPKLSIIVPVYNVEGYLHRCVDSILCQTFTDFEVILIDDGSPDCCGQIIDDYAAKDKRVIGVHQEKCGVSAARNHGLRLASGEYIGFVDADDWIEQDMYKMLINGLESNKAELGCCGYNLISDSGETKESKLTLSKNMSALNFMTEIFAIPRTVQGSVWNKIFLRERITTFFPEEYGIGEDFFFLFFYCKNIDRIFIARDMLYNVYERIGSTTRNSDDFLIRAIPVTCAIAKEAEKVSSKVAAAAEMNLLDTFMRAYYANPMKKKELKKMLKEFYKNNNKAFIRLTKDNWKVKIKLALEFML